MEKEQILSTITERLKGEGQTSLSQRTLGDYIDANLPAEGTEPDEAYWNRHTAFLKSLSINFSNDVAKTVNDFKTNYRPETNPDPKPEDKGEQSALERRLAELEAKLSASEAKAERGKLIEKAIAKGKTLKVVNEAIWEDAARSVEVGEKDSEEDVLAKTKKTYEKLLKRYHGEGAAPYGASGHTGSSEQAKEEAKSRREAYKARMKAQGRL